MTSPTFFHVDAFATSPMTGNGLTVFLDTANWSASAMQQLTREMRQFESIFLSEVSPSGAAARVFTMDEELPFAGFGASKRGPTGNISAVSTARNCGSPRSGSRRGVFTYSIQGS